MRAGRRRAGWSVHHVQDACLFDHSPSPQRCARDDGVWDDTWAATVERGGACITAEEADGAWRPVGPTWRQWM